MNILPSDHSRVASVLAYSDSPVKKIELMPQPVVNSFISPLDALPLTCTYVHIRLVDRVETVLAYFTTNLFFGIDDQCPYHFGSVICWKPCFNEGFHAIA